MKKILFLTLIFFSGLEFAGAQFSDSTLVNQWHLHDYDGSAVLILLNSDSARIQKNAEVFVFRIKKEQQFIRLADPKNDPKILSLLKVSKAQVDKKYPQNKNLLPSEKLLTAAYSFPDQKLLIGHPSSIPTSEQLETSFPDTNLADQNFSENIKAKNEDNSTNWMIFILFDIIALGIGFWIGMSLKRKREREQEKIGMPTSESNPATGDLHKLHSENMFLQQRLSRALSQLDDIKTFDHVYFDHIFSKIILPLQESLEKGNKADTMELLTIAAAQLSSISRSKISKKLKHDDANIQYMSTQNDMATSSFPEITAQTPIDKIPHHLMVLIEILKENHVKGLDETVVLGYKLKNL